VQLYTSSHTFPDHHSLKFSKRPEDKVKLPLPKVLMVVYLVAISSKGQGRWSGHWWRMARATGLRLPALNATAT